MLFIHSVACISILQSIKSEFYLESKSSRRFYKTSLLQDSLVCIKYYLCWYSKVEQLEKKKHKKIKLHEHLSLSLSPHYCLSLNKGWIKSGKKRVMFPCSLRQITLLSKIVGMKPINCTLGSRKFKTKLIHEK